MCALDRITIITIMIIIGWLQLQKQFQPSNSQCTSLNDSRYYGSQRDLTSLPGSSLWRFCSSLLPCIWTPPPTPPSIPTSCFPPDNKHPESKNRNKRKQNTFILDEQTWGETIGEMRNENETHSRPIIKPGDHAGMKTTVPLPMFQRKIDKMWF